MKRTFLAFILVISSFYNVTAQCVVKSNDTLRVACGDSGQIRTTLEPVVVGSPTTNTLNQVWFYDAFHGFIAGENGTFLRTTDSGHNWALTTFLPDQNWKSVAFSSLLNGYMVSEGGKIAKTTDGGISWNVIFDDPSMHFTRVRFINATTGFAIGEQGLILKTSDGNTWNTIPPVTTSRLNDIVFVNQVKGFVAGEYDNLIGQGVFMTTSDGGNNWVNTVVEAGCSMYNSIAFANENVGYVSGTNNTFRTTNGGTNWEPVCWMAYEGIAVHGDSTVFLCMDSQIFQYTVGSVVPEIFAETTPQWSLRGIACPDDQSVFAVGTGGFIMSYHAPVSYLWTPSAGLSATHVMAPKAAPLHTTVYTVTAQLSDGSYCTDSARVEVFRDWYSPDLCMVTVDSVTSHNRVIWNKPTLLSADSVYFYKEGSVSGQFIRLGAYSAALPGEYIDLQSNATVSAERYALKILDKCSFVSELGNVHKPVHLSINQGIGSTINMIWEPYQGADVLTYNLYRRAAAGNPELIASLPGSSTQYTDLNPPSGALTYVVEAMINANCNIKTLGTSSLSNLARYSSYPHGVGDGQVPDAFRINDNPVSGHFTLCENKLKEIARISLVSMNGKPVAVWSNPSGSSFDVSWLAPGMYILKIELKTSPLSFMQKLVKI
jgi:photosystem II stability/assembly factor-like uncharacterized protein